MNLSVGIYGKYGRYRYPQNVKYRPDISVRPIIGRALLGTAVQATRLPPQCSLCVAAGKVEMQMGVNAVFRGMPLSWVRGYLGRALAVMEGVAAEDSGDAKLSKDAVSA